MDCGLPLEDDFLSSLHSSIGLGQGTATAIHRIQLDGQT
jgi:hypothetical protein